VKQNLPNIRLFTIWLGANDSVSPGSPQHVPIDEFHKEMTSIIDLMQERSPGTPIILITPGPTQIARWDLPRNHRNRSNAQVEQYVQAIKELGARNDIPVVDAYEATWAAAGSQDEEALQQFYSDGLHLAAPGYEVSYCSVDPSPLTCVLNVVVKVVWKLVLQTIQSRFPEIDPAQVKRDFPQ
jgi:lysophospholipase L1-like esterase